RSPTVDCACGAPCTYRSPPSVRAELEPPLNADRAPMEEVGVLLHSTHRLRRRHALSLLLDARDRDPARLRAVSVVAGGQQCTVLDGSPHARALPGPHGEDDVPDLALEHVLHRRRVDPHLALLRAPGRLRARALEVSHGRYARHVDLRHVPRAAHA